MANDNGLVSAPDDQHRRTLDLTGSDARALARVRQWISEMLAGLGRSHVLEVIQVADELASNAYEHADGPRAVHVSHQPALRGTTVEVEDAHPLSRLTVGRSRFGDGAHRGHGLRIVDQIASAWGVRRSTGSREGKTVWAEIPCPASTAQSDSTP